MPKKLQKLGKNISTKLEIQNISKQGLWIFVNEKEFFLSFSKYPWFVKATIEQIYDLKIVGKKHLHWPTLDIDIDLDTLKNPDAYPLIYKN